MVYEAPLQMMCESPTIYYQEQETVDFIMQIPTVWDETVVIAASVGEYVVEARRKGAQWFLGAMTNEESREIEVELSFLPDGDFNMTAFEDGVNVDRYASDYRKLTKKVTAANNLTLKLASGGGWVARFDH